MRKIELDFKTALLLFNAERAKAIIQECIDNKHTEVPSIVENVLTKLGQEWEEGNLALSQIYMASQVCENIINELFPHSDHVVADKTPIAIVTFGDYHSLGKKIVLSVLRSVGFSITDYGQGLTIDTLVEKLKEDKIKILLISVLMLPSALKIKALCDRLQKENLNIKILVGGAPFNFDNHLWKYVGADAMRNNPAEAIEIINNWLK